MLDLIAQTDPRTIWNGPNNSGFLVGMIVVTLVVGFGAMFGLMAVPPRLRMPIVGFVTFVSGLFYVLLWLYPTPIDRSPTSAPRGTAEAFSFWLADAQPIATTLANTIAGFLLGLGIYSLLRIHLRKIAKQQTDWVYSLVLLISLIAMTVFGYWDWIIRQSPAGSSLAYAPGPDWHFPQYARDFFFDGLLQQMDAAMFSLIAFFILSAAYRAFRARSVEATVLLGAALIMILSLLTAVDYGWNTTVDRLAQGDPNSLIQNLQLTEIARWVKETLQNSSIRGLDFGVGIGLLAMGLRLWLSLEKIGGEA
jgi:hypothetical protein